MNPYTHPMIASLMSAMDASHTPAPPRREPATPSQRSYIERLMRTLELDTRYMTAFHRRFFDEAQIPQPSPNAHIDSVLCALSKVQASALIHALVAEVPDAD